MYAADPGTPLTRTIQSPLFCLNASRGVQPFGISGPHWKKKSCLGPRLNTQTLMKTEEQKKKVLSKFMILGWATSVAILGCKWPAGHRCTASLFNLAVKEDSTVALCPEKKHFQEKPLASSHLKDPHWVHRNTEPDPFVRRAAGSEYSRTSFLCHQAGNFSYIVLCLQVSRVDLTLFCSPPEFKE